MKRDDWRIIGQYHRILLFLINSIPWLFGIISIVGGFILGFRTKLIQWPIRASDFKITTPATVFIHYGAFMTIVTTFGCFAASSANKIALIIYLVLGGLLFAFDNFNGVGFFVHPSSLETFMSTIQNSTQDYDDRGKKRFGIWRSSAKQLWDFIQIRGDCCGYESYEDWRHTPLGEKDQIPIECCQSRSRNRECGLKIWSRHPKGTAGKHPITDVLIAKGCKSLFPESFLNYLNEDSVVGVFIGSCFIACFLIAFVILLIILRNKYHPDWGVLNRQKKRLSKLSIISLGSGSGGDYGRGRRGSSVPGNKISPEDGGGKMLGRYLYNSIQVSDEDADNYAPELKRRKMSMYGEPEYQSHQQPPPPSPPAITPITQDQVHAVVANIKPRKSANYANTNNYNNSNRPNDISEPQEILEEVSVVPRHNRSYDYEATGISNNKKARHF